MPRWSIFSSTWSSGHTWVSADRRCVTAAQTQKMAMGHPPIMVLKAARALKGQEVSAGVGSAADT